MTPANSDPSPSAALGVVDDDASPEAQLLMEPASAKVAFIHSRSR